MADVAGKVGRMAEVKYDPLIREEILARLRKLGGDDQTDMESVHLEADGLLLKLIGDDEITAAFHAIDKWYA
jgi:hypothetical protein